MTMYSKHSENMEEKNHYIFTFYCKFTKSINITLSCMTGMNIDMSVKSIT